MTCNCPWGERIGRQRVSYRGVRLAPVFGVKFDAGVIEKDARGTASCSYAVVGGGSARVVIRVEDRMDAGRFARLRKSRAMITGKDLMVDGVDNAAFSNEGMFAALQASRTVEISGFRTAAKRSRPRASPADWPRLSQTPGGPALQGPATHSRRLQPGQPA